MGLFNKRPDREMIRAANAKYRQAKQTLRLFIGLHWSDEKLAEAYAFNSDGKMGYRDTCGCVLGITLAPALHQHGWGCRSGHYRLAKELLFGVEAEDAYNHITWHQFYRSADPNGIHRRRLSAIIRAEMRIRDARRKAVRAPEPARLIEAVVSR